MLMEKILCMCLIWALKVSYLHIPYGRHIWPLELGLGRAVSCRLGPALSCLVPPRAKTSRHARHVMPCRYGTTNFLLGSSTARGTAARLRVVPAQARPSRCDYFWPYENTILLWYEWWLTQSHTCKVDFVIYFYVISYIRLYNAYNACYQEEITYRFANWPFSYRAGPSTTQNMCRDVPLIVLRS
jgi:hypothetical protein